MDSFKKIITTIKNDSHKVAKRIFVGFYASAEPHIFKEYSDSAIYINSASYENFNIISKPSLFYSIKLLLTFSFGYSKKLNKSSLNHNANYFLTVCAVNIGLYCFFRSFWHQAKSSMSIEEIIFLAPEISSYAAVDERIHTKLIQHGIFELGILFPQFNEVKALCDYEASYLESILNTRNIYVSKYTIIHQSNTALIVLQDSFTIDTNISIMASLINHFKECGWKIVIRTHRKINTNQLDYIYTMFPDVLMANDSQPFAQALQMYEPKVIVSWFSSCIIEAENYGITAISLCNSDIIDKLDQIILYPMKEKLLFWERDKHYIITKLIHSNFVNQ